MEFLWVAFAILVFIFFIQWLITSKNIFNLADWAANQLPLAIVRFLTWIALLIFPLFPLLTIAYLLSKVLLSFIAPICDFQNNSDSIQCVISMQWTAIRTVLILNYSLIVVGRLITARSPKTNYFHAVQACLNIAPYIVIDTLVFIFTFIFFDTNLMEMQSQLMTITIIIFAIVPYIFLLRINQKILFPAPATLEAPLGTP